MLECRDFTMETNAKRARIPGERSALVGIAEPQLVQQLMGKIRSFAQLDSVAFVSTAGQLRDRLSKTTPRVIALDETLLGSVPVVEFLRQLTEIAPVVLLALPARQAQVARLAAEGDVEFVARTGDFVSLLAALIERRLRWAERSESPLGPPWAELPGDMGEIFRHEINNPLTGILGNAELVLAHRDRLPAVDAQRLQTVVDLAVRLRETVRRLSDAWETQAHSLKSA
jgi:signal transduction histidine kinase